MSDSSLFTVVRSLFVKYVTIFTVVLSLIFQNHSQNLQLCGKFRPYKHQTSRTTGIIAQNRTIEVPHNRNYSDISDEEVSHNRKYSNVPNKEVSHNREHSDIPDKETSYNRKNSEESDNRGLLKGHS